MLSLVSCDKNSADPNLNLLVVGKWELRASHNGHGIFDEYPSGNGRIVEFSLNTYKFYEAGNLIKQGQYMIVKQQSYLTRKMENMILYDEAINNPDDQERIMIEVINNKLSFSKLSFSIDADDGPTSDYVKLR